jgi:hypothetical protein
MASYSNGVFGGLNRLLASAVAAGALLALPLALPSTALACNNGVSAVNVYKECVPSGSGGKASGGGGGGGGSHTAGGTQTSGGSTSPTTSVHVSKQTAKALKEAGKDGQSLKHLVKVFGGARLLQSSSAPAGEPTAVGSAFDLGAGPTALLIVLASTAVLMLAATGVRGVRQRRH